MGAGMWLFMLGAYIYMLLTISSVTFLTIDDPLHHGKKKLLQKEPTTGQHLQIVVLTKRLIEFFVLQHLCANVMEPMKQMKELKNLNVMEAEPHGIMHDLRRLLSFVFCAKHEPQWFSTFIADHILLVMAGVPAMFYQVLMCCRKIEIGGHIAFSGIIHLANIPTWIFIVIDSMSAIYLYVLVIGFLMMTLEGNVVPIKSRRLEHKALMCILMLFWSSNFLIILYERQIYTTPFLFGVKKVSAFLRIMASLGQLFITHSTVMLGAVLFGHSAHFHRSPDLTWGIALSKLAPTLLVAGLYEGALMIRRGVHTTGECNKFWYDLVAVPWPYFEVIWEFGGGCFLLWLALRRKGDAQDQHSNQNHGDAGSHEGASQMSDVEVNVFDEYDKELDSLTEKLDYDSVLIIGTFLIAMVALVCHIYEFQAEKLGFSTIAAALRVVAPIGLCAFALGCWQHPPRQGSLASKGSWFALLFAVTLCSYYQEVEDCEISGNQPACCNYPGLFDYNEEGNRAHHCSRLQRCLHENKEGVYCPLPHHAEVPEASEHLQFDIRPESLSAARFLSDASSPEGSDVVFDDAMCKTLNDRWAVFMETEEKGVNLAVQEYGEHEEHVSTAYRILIMVGQAGCVEMYFTVFGIMLKVIFLTQHPKSQTILAMNTHHHHVCHETGDNVVAERCATRSRGWRQVRNAAAAGALRPATFTGPSGRGVDLLSQGSAPA
eukprot:TRINITY_DN14804_c0_g1_i1.p1 TRINITY_DN14804_c0_g1~~TRINITY_DN14804_c0_g1_i1.p1  ORF type:complete len:837 (-),score=158.91 TRINITY_DN14804_c0_g1_i1:155-2299(-)